MLQRFNYSYCNYALFDKNIKPNVKAIRNALDAGTNPGSLAMWSLAGQGNGQRTAEIIFPKHQTRFPSVQFLHFFESGGFTNERKRDLKALWFRYIIDRNRDSLQSLCQASGQASTGMRQGGN